MSTLRKLAKWLRREQPVASSAPSAVLSRLAGQHRPRNSEGPRVLFATHLGAFNHGIVLDSVLGLSLRERGARPDLLLCDQFLPGCQSIKLGGTPLAEFAAGATHPRCPTCFKSGADGFAATGLPVLKLSGYVSEAERRQIRETVSSLPYESLATFEHDGIALGEHAQAGALRFYARGNLAAQPAAEAVLRRYLEGAWLAATGVDRLIEKNRYDVVVAHHGIYVPQGQVVAVCRKRGVRVVTWNPAYRKHCFIFSHDDTYHHTMVSEPRSTWDSIPWSAERDRELDAYLESRRHGTEDWIWFHDEPQFDLDRIAGQIGFDAKKPVVALLSNVVWDAQLHYGSNAFPSMIEWVLETIRHFAERPELQLVIRIHPAEVRGFVPSRQPLEAEIRARFPELPANVFLIAPEHEASTYALCDAANAVLIYNTKTGIEVTARGTPTVVAGEAWVRGKGFTRDASDPESYFQILRELPFQKPLSDDEKRLARRYAFHVFFRRMIPVPFLETADDNTMRIELDSLEKLRPGTFPGLDAICDGILHGGPFIHRSETAARAPAPEISELSPVPA